ncbi:TrbG/VirB9 family P-type conjugative transfer protein [Kiloniella laminariae]|uniref:TrbG/VirB9 family P-type conjugative transfer protein n=1 Tax=Kiloniella laminariae TaxID=454162 RepID=A0ABT4LPQ3_9PROT|nr:TrbG/VirB9 family P-type conjugative transfer protein [Kiloniella laminariae]MCZ4283108.1 TrbG/VirB9 family P-type conjugative transfer protein [Kiloniella laminariae]
MKIKKIVLAVSIFGLLGTPCFSQDILNKQLPNPDGPNLDQIQDQVDGKFPPLMNHQRLVGGAIQEIWNDSLPESGILHVKDPVGKTIKVIIRENMPLTITLPPGQKILDFTVGDQEAFDGRRCPSDEGCLWIWAKHPGFDALVSILTQDRIIYPIYVRSESFNSVNLPHTWLRLGSDQPAFDTLETAQSSASYTPKEEPLTEAINPADAPTWTRSANFDPTKIKHDLEMSGDKEIAPVNLWRDDKFTWLDWGQDNDPQRWPAAWEVVDGIDQPVRVRKSKDNRFLIVETTGPITLRRGEKTVCIRPANG